MHSSIFHFPNRYFYENKLKTAKSADHPIDKSLAAALGQVISQAATVQSVHSRANLENLEWVMNAISVMQPVLKDEMRTKVAILTPYKRQREEYEDRMLKFRKSSGLPATNTPQVATVDSFQGHEADYVLLDLVNVKADKVADIGFLKDDRRINVAVTRGKKMLWIIGGAFAGRLAELKSKIKEDENPFEPSTKAKLCAAMDYVINLRDSDFETVVDSTPLVQPIPQDLLLPDEMLVEETGDQDKEGDAPHVS
ncbi:putative helicase sen1 [Diplodia seriata]|uniref:Putative helicase sen1 n=1 Tax=Diplodia seriata TaxID=420778 RepID=A0A0G2EQ21_9PEZI|nr:putative helicase sen1 [Diplodia seriata]